VRDDGRSVLILTGSLRPGGTEIAVFRMALALKQRGRYSPQVAVLAGSGAMGQQLRDGGIPVHDLRIAGRLYGPAGVVTYLRLRRVMRAWPPALVHTFLFDADLLGLLAARASRIPTITTRRAIKRGKSAQLTAYRWTNRWAARIVANSEEVRRFTLEAEHAPPYKVSVIPNGIDLANLGGGNGRSLRQELGLPSQALVVGTLGTVKRVKGQDVLFQAMLPILVERRDVFAVVAGEAESPLARELRERAHKEGVADRFRLLGNRDDIADCLAAFDVFVLPSRSEGMSNALIEAMAAGRAIVATRVGGNAEALADGACGQLVPPEDVLAMRAAVLALLHSSEHRARLGAAAAQRAHAEYDLSTMLDRTERLYEEVLAQA